MVQLDFQNCPFTPVGNTSTMAVPPSAKVPVIYDQSSLAKVHIPAICSAVRPADGYVFENVVYQALHIGTSPLRKFTPGRLVYRYPCKRNRGRRHCSGYCNVVKGNLLRIIKRSF